MREKRYKRTDVDRYIRNRRNTLEIMKTIIWETKVMFWNTCKLYEKQIRYNKKNHVDQFLAEKRETLENKFDKIWT